MVRRPRGTLERLSGVALLDVHEDGTADYAGDTEIFWDEQRSVRDEQGKVTLVCPNGHDWKATVDAVPDPSEPVWDELAPRMLETLRELLNRGMSEDPYRTFRRGRAGAAPCSSGA